MVEYKGLVFDIMKQLAERLNFTIKVEILKTPNVDLNSSRKVPFNSTDRLLTNQVQKTVLDMVKNRRVAFGACAVTVTEELKHFINFTIPISTQTYSLLVARPKELSRALLFISPFTGDVSSSSLQKKCNFCVIFMCKSELL